MKQLLISTFSAAVILLFGGGNEVNADPLTYEVVGDTVTIKDCKETVSGALVIPATYDGKSVTSIGRWAFWKCTSLTRIVASKNNAEYSSEDEVLFSKTKLS